MRRLVGLCAAAVLAAAPGSAAAAPMQRYVASTGDAIWIAGFPAAAPAYAEFFAGLAHGPELASLKVTIVAPQEVAGVCGEGMTACYVVSQKMIVAPGPEIHGPLLAHEYGHHVAMHRQIGPPRWASHMHVCDGVRTGRLATRWSNLPTEGFADAYAQLAYPDMPWRLAPELRPTEEAIAAVLHDVVGPPVGTRPATFRGRFTRNGPRVRRFTVPARLDGDLLLELDAGAALRTRMGAVSGLVRANRSSERTLHATVCRAPGERVVVSVVRRSGTGAFTLRARFRG